MNKLFTIALAAMISLFLTTSVVGQERHDRRHKGAEHKKKAHTEKSNANRGVSQCKRCDSLQKQVAGLRKRLAEAKKDEAKKPDRRGRGRADRGRGARGRTEGRGRGVRRWDRGGDRGEAGRKRFDELLKLYRQRAEAGGRA
jgi:Flp pilus assembly protein TadB